MDLKIYNLFQFLIGKGKIDLGELAPNIYNKFKKMIEYKIINNIQLISNELTVYGNLNLSEINKSFSIPDNLYISYGRLDLENSNITELPNNLKVEGVINCSYSKIKKIGKNLECKKLWLGSTDITILPDDMKISVYIIVDPDKLSYFENKYSQYKFST